MNRMFEVTVLENQLGRPVSLDLARFTQQFENVIALDLGQVNGLNLVGTVNLVQDKRCRIR